MKYEKIEFTLPNWALSALVNGDFSGLNEEDESKIIHFTGGVINKWGNAHFIVNETNDRGFLQRNDIDSLGSDCSTGIILVPKPPVKTDKGATLGDLSRFPNFHKSGSIKGMRDKFYGQYAYLIRQGSYIYNVSSEPDLYNKI